MKNKDKGLLEKFIIDYCKKKGWDNKRLSPSQLIKLVLEKDYKKT